ncbi:hypothetical protein [Pontibacter arcticus]|uniref:hypothetical protein n=1 Tax=Pontibacter arcticus TaxID=2080288 RepID=UPI001A9EF67F|nr:hypothetical protein [Pontibacter arcticus]
MAVDNIITDRLLLIPFTLELATSLLKGNLDILKSFNLNLSEDWPDTEALETLPKIILNLEVGRQANRI